LDCINETGNLWAISGEIFTEIRNEAPDSLRVGKLSSEAATNFQIAF